VLPENRAASRWIDSSEERSACKRCTREEPLASATKRRAASPLTGSRPDK